MTVPYGFFNNVHTLSIDRCENFETGRVLIKLYGQEKSGNFSKPGKVKGNRVWENL